MDKVVVPLSSVRDITAIIFLLSALPSSLSCLVLALYILSGSSKSWGGKYLINKLLSKRLSRDYNCTGPTPSQLDNALLHSQTPSLASKSASAGSSRFYSTWLIILINSLVVLVVFCTVPKHLSNYIILFAKTVLASELIGSSSVTSTTVTSITTVTASGVTTTTTTTSTSSSASPSITNQTSTSNSVSSGGSPATSAISKKSSAPQHQQQQQQHSPSSSHDSILRNNKFINASLCFLTVININYFVREWLSTSDLALTLSLPQRNQLLVLPLNNWWAAPYVKYWSYLLSYIYLYLSIHVIIINVSPALKKYFVFEDQASTLDSLSIIAPNVPLLKNNHRIPLSFPMNMNSSSALNLAASAAPTINVEPEMEKNKIVDVNVEDIWNEDGKYSSFGLNNMSSSVVANNFEIFCSSPIGGKAVSSSSSSLFDKAQHHHPLNETTSHTTSLLPPKANGSGANGNSGIAVNGGGGRSRSGTLGNSTTIVNKVLTSVVTTQPLWSLLAAIKTIVSKPAYFSGKMTKYKNNGGKFVTKINHPSYISISTVYIDDTKAVFKILDVANVAKFVSLGEISSIKIKLNEVDWIHKKFLKTKEDEYFICIYGLTPLFQYELEVYKVTEPESDSCILLSHCIFNTISSSGVLNQSPETTSSLLTLQLSLNSTIDKLNQSKSKLKKFKRDENKKHSELKKDIENLRNKISKYNTKQNIESRVSGKLKGLKHSVLQLEGEIEELKKSVEVEEDQSTRTEIRFQSEEAKLKNKINGLTEGNSEFENSINKFKKDLKNLNFEFLQLQSKNERLKMKMDLKLEELNKVQVEIKNTKKNELMQKSSKRNKRYQERYEVILPNLSHAIAELQRELEEILNSNSVSGSSSSSKGIDR
ncbi:hypothetical protein CLIB1423_27S00188 [[Candida] railenensis]|uniref:Uncharacterized protein n=1 Tax=[Candida] railenensis TaxID=45579 RepID=A0A9P0QW76_9ASCO|nr:hypothetical protein CLIB1423_27S00188 [[Candida] railenensis]